MKILCKSLLSVLFCLCCINLGLRAQDKKYLKKAQRAAMQQQMQAYTEAEGIAVAAKKLLNEGQVKTSDSMINRSIMLYPTNSALDYAQATAQLPNMPGASKLIYAIFDRVLQLPNDTIITTLADKAVNSGGMFHYSNYKKVNMLKYDVLYLMAIGPAYRIIRNFGNKADLIQELTYMLNIEPMGKADPRIENLCSRTARINLFRLQGDFAAAISIYRSSKDLGGDEIHKQITSLYFENGDYNKVIQRLEGRTDDYARAILFNTYVMLGDPVSAKEKYDQLLKANKAAAANIELIYYDAILDIHIGKYKNAMGKLMGLIAGRGKAIYANGNPSWALYTALGKAYVGLGDYHKAKDNFHIALLYDAAYQPAIDGLSKLEATNATLVANDKTGPVITLSEPAAIVGDRIKTNTPKIFLKGNAADASGIKEVTFNGQRTFIQANGSFWGEFPLTPGNNVLKIAARDVSGNSTIKTIIVERKTAPILNDDTIIPVTEKEGKNYCLLVAAQNYRDVNIPSLANPIADAVKLKLILKDAYNFDDENLISLFNPSANDLRRQLLELNNLIQPEDNLVIFYAGHGIWVEKEKRGYWLLTDAKRNDVNTWLPNKAVLDIIAKLPNRHTLLITDACFSGSVFKSRGLEPASMVTARKMEDKICRVAITSGNDSEVPDESVFMKYLIKALSQNKEKYLIAQKMFINQILEAVMTETKTEPRYGTLELAGHIGGDFVFTKR